VAGLTRADLRTFHKTYYRPDSTLIAVVGDITPQQAAEKITRVLGSWHVPGPAHPVAIPDVRGLTTAFKKIVSIPGKTQADIILGFPGLARSSADFHPANVANLILGVLGLSGRLGDSVRDKQGLAYYVYSSVRAGIGAGPWVVRAGVNPANVDKAIAGIMDELTRLRQDPVSADELSEAQDYLTGSLALRLETNDGVASMLLNMETFNLGLDYLERYNGIIRGLTAPLLLETAQKYIDLERLVVVVAGPV
jgi:zinc protease